MFMQGSEQREGKSFPHSFALLQDIFCQASLVQIYRVIPSLNTSSAGNEGRRPTHWITFQYQIDITLVSNRAIFYDLPPKRATMTTTTTSTAQHRSSSGGIFIISHPFSTARIHFQDMLGSAGGTPELPAQRGFSRQVP